MKFPYSSYITITEQITNAPKVKICGIMALADAQAAVAHGADFLGFIFVKGRRRCMTIQDTSDIIRQLGSTCPPAVGLFVNEDPATVRHVAAVSGLQYAQLCGSESPDYCAALGMLHWKVINLHSAEDCDRMTAYRDATAFVLEGSYNGPGGTGQSWDWSLAGVAPHDRRIFLAGGLSPDNVHSAVAQVRPWGVDVSSGVETEGKKDPDKIAAFIHNARDASFP
ncbi:MAG: phosphoribosylanthranilate isomerase [Chloroflexota bacterium]|nr:phosphoribosylanthranilate isomerase [Chloroflexota bacterium]